MDERIPGRAPLFRVDVARGVARDPAERDSRDERGQDGRAGRSLPQHTQAGEESRGGEGDERHDEGEAIAGARHEEDARARGRGGASEEQSGSRPGADGSHDARERERKEQAETGQGCEERGGLLEEGVTEGIANLVRLDRPEGVSSEELYPGEG